MRKRPFIAANWKMNPPPPGWDAPGSPYRPHPDVDVLVFPTYLDLERCVDAELNTGAQCGHHDDTGPRTGNISMKMLSDLGCLYVLCGHSERRKGHGETDDDVAAQAYAALKHDLHPIVCIGETEAEREAGKEEDTVRRQITTVVRVIGDDANVTWAYEPVWAIGTGKNATPEQAQAMHAYIRSLLPEDRREAARILYGGSMNEKNAAELLRQPDIDVGLVGGASLKPEAFRAIITAAANIRRG